MLVSQILVDWLNGQSSLLSCLLEPTIDVNNLFGGIIQWKASMFLCGHLWYVFSYVKVILWYPLVAHICTKDSKANMYRYFLFALTFIGVLITDIQQFYLLPIGEIKPYFIIDNSLFYVLLGHEMSIHKGFIDRKRNMVIKFSGAIFILSNLLRFVLTVNLMKLNSANDYFLHINSINSFISSIALFLFLLCIFEKIKFSEKMKRFILSIASKTFLIYLIHRALYQKLNTLGVRYEIYSWSNGTLLSEVTVMLVYAIVVFVSSLLLATILQKIRVSMKRILDFRQMI